MPTEMLLSAGAVQSRPLWLLTEADLPRWLSEQPREVADWVRGNAFQAQKHRVLAYPSRDGTIEGAVAGLGSLGSLDELKLWHAAGLADRLAPHAYHVANRLTAGAATHFVLGWLMGAYRMTRYSCSAGVKIL